MSVPQTSPLPALRRGVFLWPLTVQAAPARIGQRRKKRLPRGHKSCSVPCCCSQSFSFPAKSYPVKPWQKRASLSSSATMPIATCRCCRRRRPMRAPWRHVCAISAATSPSGKTPRAPRPISSCRSSSTTSRPAMSPCSISQGTASRSPDRTISSPSTCPKRAQAMRSSSKRKRSRSTPCSMLCASAKPASPSSWSTPAATTRSPSRPAGASAARAGLLSWCRRKAPSSCIPRAPEKPRSIP
jgi:hypothetical protein